MNVRDINLENTMRPSCLSALVATAALSLVAACGNAGGSGAHSMGKITSTIEKSGFTCEVKERYPKTMSQVAQCRSNQDKYLLLIASEWKDAKARDKMYEQTVPGICSKLGIKDQVRWSTSGNWSLVAGASKSKDIKALDEATKALGFKPHAATCQ